MKSKAFLLLLIVMTTLVKNADCRQRKKNRMVIRCCGRPSCINVIKKNRNTTNSRATFESRKVTDSKIASTAPKSTSEVKINSLSSQSEISTTLEVKEETTTISRIESHYNSIVAKESTELTESTLSSTISLNLTTGAKSLLADSNATLTTMHTNMTTTTTDSNTTSTSTTSTTTATTTSISTTTTSTSTTTTSTTTRLTKPPTPTTKAPMDVPTCPSTCVKDQSFFKTDGSLDGNSLIFKNRMNTFDCIDPDFHGFWRTGCGQLYMFGKVLVNWEQNMDACCKLGMTPITFSSINDARCFENFTEGPKWGFNSRYWTSGVRQQGTTFRWCHQIGGEVPTVLWGGGQPTYSNNSDNCALMNIIKKNSSLKLDDRPCGALSALACQGPTTKPPPCVSPVCPDIKCKKNMNFYKIAVDGNTAYLRSPNDLGTWVNGDMSFMFSFPNDTRTFTGALQACCEVGFKLVSLHMEHKYNGLIEAMKSAGVSPGLFWTSGTDMGCEDSFGYCSVNRLLRNEAKWKPGQPDNLNGRENCAALELNDKSALLLDEDCDKKYRFICEGRLKSGVEIIERECSAAFNLTSAEARSLQSASPKDIREKCFLMCFGDGMSLFVNGKFVEERLIAQFASISGGDIAKLADMYSTLNFCSGQTRGMDICDKVAKLFDCGKENSPEAVSGLMKNLETAFTEAPVILPPEKAICPVDYSCLEEQKTAYDAAAHDSYLQKFPGIAFSKVIHACGVKYLFLRLDAPGTFVGAMEACCSFGLRLMTIRSQAQMTCVNQVYQSQANLTAINPTGGYTIAASRMEYISKPIWCFTGELVDLSWATDAVTSNTNVAQFAFYITFGTTPTLSAWSNALGDVACEQL